MKGVILLTIAALVLAGSLFHELFHVYQFGSIGIGAYEVCVLGVHHNGNVGGWTTPDVKSAVQSEMLEQQRSSLEFSAYQFQFLVMLAAASGIIYAILRKQKVNGSGQRPVSDVHEDPLDKQKEEGK